MSEPTPSPAGPGRPARPRVVMVGQVPPPHHGQAIATQVLFEHRFELFDAVPIPMHYSRSTADVGRVRPGKLTTLGRLTRRTVAVLRGAGGAWLYYLPASPHWVPILRDLLFLGMVRRHCLGTIYHFHAGGLAAFLRARPVLAGVARRVYGRSRLAIELYAQGEDSAGAFLGAERVAIIPNGLDVEPPGRMVPARRTPGAPFHILYVGALEPAKGLFDVLETAARLRNTGHAFRMIMVGPWRTADIRRSALAQVARAGLGDRIEFPGVLTGSRKWEEYARADAFFFPTHYESENLPLNLIEAMAYGLPIVATHWRGIPHLVGENEAALLLPIRDPAAYADALATLMRDPARAEALGAAGRRRYAAGFTADIFRRRVERAIARAIGVLPDDNADPL